LWAGWIGSRIGFARALGLGLAILSAGCFLRSVQGPFEELWRYSGTVLIGAGIAIGNVLLPGIVKSRYPDHVGLLTSLYSTALNLGAAMGIAFAVPMADRLSGGWSMSLAMWGGMAFVSLAIWSPQLLKVPSKHRRVHPLAGVWSLMSKKRAWQVTAHMGLQSIVFYSAVAWLPSLLQWRGIEEVRAAHWVAAMQLLGCVASIIVPTLAGRSRSQSWWSAGCAFTSALSLMGILFLPEPWLWVSLIFLGFGLNASFGVGLLLIAMRSRDADTSASLSSLAQAVGYLFAAPGPWLFGWLSTITGGWTLVFCLIAAIAFSVGIVGLFAGRPGVVGLDTDADSTR
jgi:MFS transporter, CP family, cyanate transporter